MYLVLILEPGLALLFVLAIVLGIPWYVFLFN